jgi:DNA-binding response OmpR family regulator
MIKLLLIEDDVNLGYMIKSSLEEIIEGYDVKWVTNGKEGLAALDESRFDIIVSDVEMPFLDGKEMVKRIRSSNNQIPIIFVSAKIATSDVTEGYDAGANLYIKKPFQPEEIDAHIKSVLKLTHNHPVSNEEIIYQLGKYTFYPQQFVLKFKTTKKHLTALESNILAMLCENRGKVVLKDDILAKYWQPDYDYQCNSRSLNVFISKLRSYVSADKSVSITALKKVGLRLDVKK